VIRETGRRKPPSSGQGLGFWRQGGGTLAVQTLQAIEQTHRSHRFVAYLTESAIVRASQFSAISLVISRGATRVFEGFLYRRVDSVLGTELLGL
jgi:hypothetical protein